MNPCCSAAEAVDSDSLHCGVWLKCDVGFFDVANLWNGDLTCHFDGNVLRDLVLFRPRSANSNATCNRNCVVDLVRDVATLRNVVGRER